MTVSPYDLATIRKQMRDKMASRPQDPFEFRPPKPKVGETIKYKVFVLAPLRKGDKCAGGVASNDAVTFAIKNGQHWVNKRPYPCPRIFSNEECEMCQTGFDMLDDTEDKKQRSTIAKQWLPQTQYMVNLFFPPVEPNPPNLHRKVLFYNAPKTCYDHWEAALYRNGPGDPQEPDAYGVIYDELRSFLYSLTIIGGKDYPDYKSSRFLANLGPNPLVTLPDGSPDMAAIKAIMDSRHDLLTKIDMPNPSKMSQLTHSLLHADSIQPDSDDQGSDASPQAAQPQAAQPQAAQPQTVAPQTAAPQTAAPQAAQPQTVAPQTVAPQAAQPQAAPVTPALQALPDEDGATIEDILKQLQQSRTQG